MEDKNTCPECRRFCTRFSWKEKEGKGIFVCSDCRDYVSRTSSALLHRYENKDCKTLSVSKERVIQNRYKAPNGQVLDRRTNKPSER